MNATVDDDSALPIHEIRNYLPHRYPLLLIDRVLECRPGEFVLGIKNVTVNEPFFNGHFPQRPVMPGVLILEAMAQACGMLAFKTVEQRSGEPQRPDHTQLIYLVGIDKAKFKRPVEPGDQLRLMAKLHRSVHGIWMFHGEAHVDGALVASAEIRCTVRDV